MGRPRKKAIEPEIIPDDQEIEIAPRTAKRKHTVEMEYVEEVPIDEAGEVITDDIEDDLPEVAERKAYVKSERERIRDKLKKAGVSSNQPLRLRVDRLPNYKTDGASGMAAEKAFAFAMDCDEAFITNGESLPLEIQKRCGPGDYWVTVRYRNSVLDNWKELIAPPNIIATPVTDPVTGQTIIYQQAPQQNGVKSPTQKQMFQEMAETIELVDRIRGKPERVVNPEPAQAPMDNETAFLKVLASDPEIVNAAREKVRGWAFGDEGGGRRQSLTEMVVMEGMKQFGPVLAQLAQAGAEYLATKARGGNSGPAQMGQTQMAQSGQAQIAGTTADGMAQATQDSSGQTAGTPNSGGNASPVSPLLSNLLSALKANQAPKEVAALIRGVMETDRSVIPLIEGLLDLRPHQILIQLATFGGPQAVAIVAMPHSEIWVEDLITEMNIETEPEEKEDGSETDA